MAETELGLEDVALLHALEELLGMETNTTDDLERVGSSLALDAELGLDGTAEVLLLDTEENGGAGRGGGALGGGLGEVELEEVAEERVEDACEGGEERGTGRSGGRRQRNFGERTGDE